RDRFGFVARTSFEEGLRRTVDWYRSDVARVSPTMTTSEPKRRMTERVQGTRSSPSTFRRIAKALLPPIVVTAVRSLTRRSQPGECEYLGTSWRPVESEGWDSESIVRTQRASWREFGAGIAE